MNTLPVIKIEMAGTVTSFRYPHFTQGVHPTFEMPPPSTIYGHICSVVGDWIDPTNLLFGYHFTHAGKFIDYKEHLHFDDPIQPFPFDRELLFEPRLTLYLTYRALLDSPFQEKLLFELRDAFRHPHYTVVLGRSQDLMTHLSIDLLSLHKATEGYFQHTLLPLMMAPRLSAGTIAVTMARYINPRRQSQWESYAVLQDTAIWPPSPRKYRHIHDENEDERGLIFEGDESWIQLWIDPESPPHRKYPHLHRLVWLHSFLES